MLYNLIISVLTNRDGIEHKKAYQASKTNARFFLIFGMVILILNSISICVLINNALARTLMLFTLIFGTAALMLSCVVFGELYGAYLLNRILEQSGVTEREIKKWTDEEDEKAD